MNHEATARPIACTLMSVLGERFGDGGKSNGLQDLLVESGVIDPPASKLVISWQAYNSVVYAHGLVSETLLQVNCQNWAASEEALPFDQAAALCKTAPDSFRDTGIL